MRAWKCSSTRVSPTGTCCKRPRGSRASEQSDEFAAFHCPMPPVLPREKDSTPQLRQETAALQDFDWAYDRPGELCAAVYRAGKLAQSGLTAKDTQSGIGQFFGIALPLLGKLDDRVGNRRSHGTFAIRPPSLFVCRTADSVGRLQPPGADYLSSSLDWSCCCCWTVGRFCSGAVILANRNQTCAICATPILVRPARHDPGPRW